MYTWVAEKGAGRESQDISLETAMGISSGTEGLTNLRTWNLGLKSRAVKSRNKDRSEA